MVLKRIAFVKMDGHLIPTILLLDVWMYVHNINNNYIVNFNFVKMYYEFKLTLPDDDECILIMCPDQ